MAILFKGGLLWFRVCYFGGAGRLVFASSADILLLGLALA